MEAVKLKARVKANAELEWLDTPNLPEGEVEVILLYKQREEHLNEAISPLQWPVLDGGEYRGGSLRREDMYGDNGR